MEKIAIISMTVRVKEVSPADIEKNKELFRVFLSQTMDKQADDFVIKAVPILPKCVGISKIDRRTLFSGMAVRRAKTEQFEFLKSDLTKGIISFLDHNEIKTEVPNPVTINLYHINNSVDEFVAASNKALDALNSGPLKSSQIAGATGLDDQLNNILLCMLEEQGLVRRQETDEVDDIFYLITFEAFRIDQK
ncbi:hypothetical protein [Desulfomonile tiedjei]|uniref:Uncharacterized protein n=1 Tax=Desulfomonile tiedjei (strain ATCC 49306 / DSM 6799 / DCB-1) TaxID=706587 RepID=I4C5M8_DESTA|nr:hypothetical protein [Desulfomonile tiedjei]AFM24869.1 hypothetical protein Desti_2172 [Desulfomonile tiedjei DSM 6799]